MGFSYRRMSNQLNSCRWGPLYIGRSRNIACWSDIEAVTFMLVRMLLSLCRNSSH